MQDNDSFKDKVDKYWINRVDNDVYACPNVSLFRLIGSVVGKSLFDKKILEVGFGYGADLIECKRRLADVVGLDLNKNFVDTVKEISNCDVRQFRAGVDTIPFEQKFDLIYSNDTIYYLSDNELEHFLRQCALALKKDGKLIVSFIETDLRKKDQHLIISEDFELNFLNKFEQFCITERENPIRFLSADAVIAIAENCGLALIAVKKLLESYDLQEAEIRVNKYVVFQPYDALD